MNQIIKALCVICAGLGTIGAMPALAACNEGRVELRGDWGHVRFRVDVVDTPQTRSQGLMHVAYMPQFQGMLFVYDRPQPVSFWMENTLIPLDMIFADETGTVRHIHENAIPLDRTPISGGDAIKYVLEINAGLVDDLGLNIGSELRHPAINQDQAAWPCAQE